MRCAPVRVAASVPVFASPAVVDDELAFELLLLAGAVFTKIAKPSIEPIPVPVSMLVVKSAELVPVTTALNSRAEEFEPHIAPDESNEMA